MTENPISQNALLQAPDVASFSSPLTITVLPALPAQWSSGEMKGARVRGGITVDLKWANGKLTSVALTVDAKPVAARPVRVVYGSKTIASFTTTSRLSKTITRF